MEYAYPDFATINDCQDRRDDYAKAIDKGLLTTMKEDKLPFPKLLAKLRKESETMAHQHRRSWKAPHESLFGPFAGYAVVDGYVCTVKPGTKYNGYCDEVTEQLYPLSEFWQRVIAQTENLYRKEGTPSIRH